MSAVLADLKLTGKRANKVKKHVYRVGDKVRVLNPLWVKRVGYPLVWTDLVDEVEQDPRTYEALQALGYDGYFYRDGLGFYSSGSNAPREFVQAVAMLRVKERGFGGKERQLFYEEPNDYYKGFCLEVYSKRVVKTGTYYPPTRWGSGEDYDEEPGGLENCKTHVLLQLGPGEIEACNVEPAR